MGGKFIEMKMGQTYFMGQIRRVMEKISGLGKKGGLEKEVEETPPEETAPVERRDSRPRDIVGSVVGRPYVPDGLSSTSFNVGVRPTGSRKGRNVGHYKIPGRCGNR